MHNFNIRQLQKVKMQKLISACHLKNSDIQILNEDVQCHTTLQTTEFSK